MLLYHRTDNTTDKYHYLDIKQNKLTYIHSI